ncbi:MAG TPA: 5-methyltetrahydropteroyltriglutamate--homocysteine S-methyltransferase [Candidatus Eremiobacteraceae bacterium]|nr:5-methyltetrahydropteroyltriglutamate--homocysteine S-methyltransferase [Candidatus Eremiobacteraceae bacterium]
MAVIHTLGFPRIGHKRELKKALEAYWKGASDGEALSETGRSLRRRHWQLQRDAGLDFVPTGDFSYYDHMLDTSAMLGAVPARYDFSGGQVDFKTYFAMARGTAAVPAMEMTKWFDTNYHYIVPEFEALMEFGLHSTKIIDETREALEQGFTPKPVLVGPISYLWLGKERAHDGRAFSRLDLLPRLLPVYREVLARLKALGVGWVQMDEPALVTGLPAPWVHALEDAYRELAPSGPNMLLATYFESVQEHAAALQSLPVAGLHLDLVRAPGQLDTFLAGQRGSKVLSLGVIDGRNVWRADLSTIVKTIERAREKVEQLWVAPSCSLMHAPVDLAQETKLDPQLRSWMAFSVQKLGELATLKRALNEGREAVEDALQESDAVQSSRAQSPRIHSDAVAKRVAAFQESDAKRTSNFAVRQARQRKELGLPPFPTTTIGSFPQTTAIREARAKFRKGDLTSEGYELTIHHEIENAIREQERLGLDVLVHGEAERNDMVEYFGEQLAGFAFTEHGWVQSYGSRYVKPPIIFGDVARPKPMTVRWIKYAQSLTDKPLKGMLTGPVTILQWSFVRDDQPRSETATQIALAIRDEVSDLERAGIRVIQIDEPAFREGLPLKRKDWTNYIAWAARAFRIASSSVADATQIHTHMCYSEFNDIFEVLALLDADVITIESSRSGMELLDAFQKYRYPNEIGPGVYDIHSPRIPSSEEMHSLLEKAAQYLSPEQLWVNPDCGLKTRRWEEVTPALRNMVDAAKRMRGKVPVG